VRQGALLRLILVALVFGAAAFCVAYFIDWFPTSASEERGRIDFVIWFTTAICIAIFALVASVIVYSVLNFRARPDDDSDGPPIHGHTGLEMVWTAIPAILVLAIAIVSGVALAKNDELPKGDYLRVQVTGVQFAWSFKYLKGNTVTTGVLRLPRGRSTVLEITSKDVIHSFWVPEFGQKLDALPGDPNNLKITPNKVGTYPVICTELCGLGHAVMRSEAIVMEPAAFDKWLDEQTKKMETGGPAAGKAVFTNNGCNACHTLRAAGASGKIGPDLDKLPQQAARAGKPLEEFVHESIVEPDKYIEAGYPKSVMPQDYEKSIPQKQLDDLVAFLVDASKGAK
jgi:cytochrome c oxidase subunit 2